MNNSVHPGLLSLIDKKFEEATSPKNESDYVDSRLLNEIIEQIHIHHLSSMYYEKIISKMKENNAKKRNYAFQILSALVLHSPKVRFMYARDLYIIANLILGIRSKTPEPNEAMIDLRNRFIENMEIMEVRYGKQYPHFSICREYLYDYMKNERKSEKRLHPTSSQTTISPKPKRHSMDILVELVNKTVWELYRHIDYFEYEYDVNLESESTPSTFDSLIDAFIQAGSHLTLNGSDVTQQQDDYSTKMKQAYEGMEKGQKTLKTELIPTLERNRLLLQSRHTEKSQIALDKVEDMLERCQITSQRCTQLLFRGKERYGNMDSFI